MITYFYALDKCKEIIDLFKIIIKKPRKGNKKGKILYISDLTWIDEKELKELMIEN